MKIVKGLIYAAAGTLSLVGEAMAHGDHSSVTPEHGIEHMLIYGVGIIAVLALAGRLGRRAETSANDRATDVNKRDH